jgi:hypothetical protein
MNEKTTRGKVNGYTHKKADARQALRSSEAAERQDHYDSLTTKERIELARSRRGESKRDLARLQKRS